MKVKEFYSDSDVAALLAKYVEADDLVGRFAKTAADLSSDECLIPVLGTQGAGKSSFLNALLFGDILLPVDADETTCIPTSIRYGENEKPEAFVVLASGERRKVECTERGLADYVHQERNPGNQKGVSHIEIFVRNDLLKSGIVFVDLPGVGSITEANQKTTIGFLQKCTAAIFLLRTVPPITQSESVFIQGALPLMGRVFWVQNKWTDESNDEVSEGRDHSYKVLKDIARRLRLPEETITQPDVVCVKQALDGRIQDDAARVDGSGILAFRDAVVRFAEDWRREVFEGKRRQAVELLKSAIEQADKKISRLTGDVEVEHEKIRQEKRKMEDVLDHDTKLVRQARNFLSERKSALTSFIGDECRKFAENLRNGVRESIDGGLVGGEQLNRAFQDYVKCGNEEMFESIQPAFIDITTQLSQILSGLALCDLGMNKSLLSAGGSEFSDKSKIHAYYGVAGSIVGTAAGIKIGAAVGSFIPIPVVGTIVGSVIGGLIGLFCGNCAREVHVETQKETARQELFEAVQKLEREALSNYVKALENFTSSAETNIRSWLKSQKSNVDARYQKAFADLEKPIAEKAQLVKEVEKDKSMFARLVSEME